MQCFVFFFKIMFKFKPSCKYSMAMPSKENCLLFHELTVTKMRLSIETWCLLIQRFILILLCTND